MNHAYPLGTNLAVQGLIERAYPGQDESLAAELCRIREENYRLRDENYHLREMLADRTRVIGIITETSL